MDLIERGRSLSEIGRTLTWTDIRALLLHLPDEAHVRRLAPPTTDTPPADQPQQPARRVAPVRRRASASEIRQRVKALET